MGAGEDLPSESPHSSGLSLGRCSPAPSPLPQARPQRSEHHQHRQARASPASGGLSFGRCPQKKRALSASVGPLLPQMPREKRASLASAGLLLAQAPSYASGEFSLGKCVPLHRSEHHRHQQGKTAPDAREAISICIKWPPPPHALPGAPPKKRASTASAGPRITCIGWTLAWQLPRPKKRASSASGGLLLVKLPEHHLHQVDSRLAVAPPEGASIIGIRRAAPGQTARASSASGGLSFGNCATRRSEHHRHQEGCSLSNCLSMICIRWTLAWQLPHPKKRASSASGGLLLVKLPGHHLHQVDSRLAVAPPEEASIIGIRRAAPCQTARASSASGGLSLGSCPARRSEHHRHQEGCSWSNCPSIICIRWTLVWQLRHPKKRASSASGGLLLVKLPEHDLHQVDSRLAVASPEEASIIGIRRAAPCQTARASSASGGLSLGSCPARRSEHHRHQEGCSLSNCPSIICIRWTLACQVPPQASEHHRHQEGSSCQTAVDSRFPPPGKRASSASAGLLLVTLPEQLPEHHLHQMVMRLAGAPTKKRASSDQLGCFFYKYRASSASSASMGAGEHLPSESPHSSGLPLGKCSPGPAGASPKKLASSASAGPSITCIRRTFVWQVPAKEASIIGIGWTLA